MEEPTTFPKTTEVFPASSEFLPTSSESSVVSSRAWIDIFLPIMLLGFSLLFVVVCYGSIVRLVYKCKCRGCWKHSTRESESSHEDHDNPNCEDTTADPVFYIAVENHHSSLPEFAAVANRSTDLPFRVRTNSTISDKLPTYEEYMEEKLKKQKTAENHCNTGENIELTDADHSVESREPHDQDSNGNQSESENDSTSLPPPYSN